MAALAILNPRPRARKAAGRSGRRRRKPMTAKQLKFFGPRKTRKAAKRKARAKSKVIIVQSNPKGSSMAAKKKTRHRRRKAKVFTHPKGRVRRMRRNPRSIEAGFFNNTLVPAMIGAGGAIAADALLSYAPVPPQLKSGVFGVGLKIASALLVGMAVGAVSSREAGEEAAAGGVIVTLYGVSRGFIAGHAGQGWGAWMNGSGQGQGQGAGMNRYAMGRYAALGSYAPGAMNRGQGAFAQTRPGLAYLNPARISAPPGSRANLRFLASR